MCLDMFDLTKMYEFVGRACESMEFGERANHDLLFYIENGKFFRVFEVMQFDGDEKIDFKYRKVNARQVDVEELDASIQALVLGGVRV